MNSAKFDAYKQAFSLMNLAKHEHNIAYSIASIAIAESMLNDRMSSFIQFKDQNWILAKKSNFISSGILSKRCNIYFPKLEINSKTTLGNIETSDLFSEIQNWLISRNFILHTFVKNHNKKDSQNLHDFYVQAIKTSEDGLKLCKLTNKWFKQQKTILR
jgi:hypothetical protein